MPGNAQYDSAGIQISVYRSVYIRPNGRCNADALQENGLPHQSADWFAMTNLVDFSTKIGAFNYDTRCHCEAVRTLPWQSAFPASVRMQSLQRSDKLQFTPWCPQGEKRCFIVKNRKNPVSVYIKHKIMVISTWLTISFPHYPQTFPQRALGKLLTDQGLFRRMLKNTPSRIRDGAIAAVYRISEP